MELTPQFLNVIGLVANIIGTVILAFSINGYIKSMRLAIDSHEIYILSVTHPNKRLPIVQFTGTDVHMNRDQKRSSNYSWIGIFLVLSGFVVQLYSYFL